MPFREVHYRWEWTLQAPPEALWPLVADTNRFNHDAGLPAVRRRPGEGASLSDGRRRLRFVHLGLTIEWEEEPFEWVRPQRFGVVRRYLNGPIAEIRVLADLSSRPEGGSHLVYQVWAEPRTLTGLLAIPLQIGWVSRRRFASIFRRYDALAVRRDPPLEPAGRPRFAPGGRARLTQAQDALVNQGAPSELVARLADLIQRADDLALTRIRPYALADAWGTPRRAMLELCLLATRIGLLDFRWDLLCPLCRGAGQSSASLGDIRSQVHCESCHIDFSVNFDHSVELTFQPNPSIRQVERMEFCVGGPQVTPHIVAQQILPPGDQRMLTLPLEEGRYRIRSPQLPGGQFALVAPDGAPEATLRPAAAGWPQEELRLGRMPALRLENATQSRQVIILERLAWSDQAATAADVTVLQRFRDLFAREVLRPGEQISVGSLTIVFTDLRDSTRLYQEIGDATAFGTVLSHFDVLRETIAAEDGALVKTIGDAVMAVFRRPASALRAILHAQRLLASPRGTLRPLRLKAGIHAGPCIAITLNERLDYFGSTVNIAARLGGLSSGQEAIISSAVRNDPEVAELLGMAESPYTAEPMEATLKGFGAERFSLWRVAQSPTGPGAEAKTS